LASKTQTFDIPFRPSTDATDCTGGRWFDGATCFNGLAVPITFDFTTGPAVLLPSQVIWTVSYNTSHYGPSPIGEGAACYTSSGGCGYDSLNVGLNTSGNSVGTDTDTNGVFMNNSGAANYCDSGAGGTGTLRLDTGCWAPYTPAGELQLAGPPGPPHIGAAVGPGDGSADVSFTPGSTGYASGAGFTSFHVSCQSSNGGASGFASGPGSPIHVSGLTNGKTYTCTVTATNGAGTSNASTPAGPVVPSAVPDPPTITSVTRGDSSISVAFNEGASNGGFPVTSYTAEMRGTNVE